MFDPKDFTPELTELLGDGTGLRGEALATGCDTVEPVHLLAFLARSKGSVLRAQLLEPRGVDLDGFRAALYGSAPAPDGTALDAVWGEFASAGGGGERALLRILLRHTTIGHQLLTAIAGTPDELEAFLARPDTHRVVRAFDGDGRLLRGSFEGSGHQILDVLREEIAALGGRRATVLHLLYALVGVVGGVMQRALMFQGIDPVREVHGYLARELARPGAKRASNVDLSVASMHEPVAQALRVAAIDATREGTLVREHHVARALVAPDRGMVAGWLAGRGVRLDPLREYLLQAQSDEPDEQDDGLVPLDRIESALAERILGQPHAIKVTLPWIKKLRFGHPRDRGTAGVMLFIGASGTGKTELAKQIARTVYGSADRLLHLEMSQFQTDVSVNNFIGAPPGYVGYGEGKLTTGLRDKAPCVVLFDEFEKAKGSVFTALLRFLDEGLISDPAGPTRDGRGCIVVLTGNLGHELDTATLAVDEETGQPTPQTEAIIRRLVVSHVERPEIYNRIDEKVVFHPLGPEVYTALVRREVELECGRFAERGTRVEVDAEVLDWLTVEAMSVLAEGARSVPRLVSRYVVGPVIDHLCGSATPKDKIRVCFGGDG